MTRPQSEKSNFKYFSHKQIVNNILIEPSSFEYTIRKMHLNAFLS